MGIAASMKCLVVSWGNFVESTYTSLFPAKHVASWAHDWGQDSSCCSANGLGASPTSGVVAAILLAAAEGWKQKAPLT
jgi:hypothetical protein